MALSEDDRAEIAELIASATMQTAAPPPTPEGEPTIIVAEPLPTPELVAAEADAAVAIIDAQASADVKREHAYAETQTEVIAEQAKADAIAGGAETDGEGNIIDDALSPASQHWYFKSRSKAS